MRDLDGPPRMLTIRHEIPRRELIFCVLVVAAIGFWLAMGHS